MVVSGALCTSWKTIFQLNLRRFGLLWSYSWCSNVNYGKDQPYDLTIHCPESPDSISENEEESEEDDFSNDTASKMDSDVGIAMSESVMDSK